MLYNTNILEYCISLLYYVGCKHNGIMEFKVKKGKVIRGKKNYGMINIYIYIIEISEKIFICFCKILFKFFRQHRVRICIMKVSLLSCSLQFRIYEVRLYYFLILHSLSNLTHSSVLKC